MLKESTNIHTILLGDSIINGLSRYNKVWKNFFGSDTMNCGIGGDKVENILWRAENLNLPSHIKNVIIHCGTNNLHKNTSEEIADGLMCTALTITKEINNTKVFITGLLPRDHKGSHLRSKIKAVNDLILRKCSSLREAIHIHFAMLISPGPEVGGWVL